LVPYLVLLARGRIRPAARVRELAFYLLFWGYKGLEVDALYRFQGFVFGSEASAAVIGAKVAFDQFVYNPLWAAPSQTLAFAWKDAGFSAEGLRMRLRESSLRGSVLVVLLATWVVWIPAVAIIYS